MTAVRRIIAIVRAGHWLPAAANDRVILDYDTRHRRRIRIETVNRRALLLDEPRAVVLRGGDGLKLETGEIVAVEAANEALMEVTAPSRAALLRFVWHVGNRHLPVALGEDRIYLRQDHVIADMLKGLGASVRPVIAPFEPEGGAYDESAHGHDHGHVHD